MATMVRGALVVGALLLSLVGVSGCSDGGVAGDPVCAPGQWGPSCAPCVCVNGSCDDGADGTGACLCDGGYVGLACDACPDGQQDNDGDGTCRPGCAADSCSGNGVCDDSSGDVSCVCEPPYAGPACAVCDPDAPAPQLLSAAWVQLEHGDQQAVLDVAFDRLVTIADVVVDGGAQVSLDGGEPSVAVVARELALLLDALSGIHRVELRDVVDSCGLVATLAVEVCAVREVVFGFAGEPQAFVVPACADGLVSLEARGAQGTAGVGTGAGSGGLGAAAFGELPVVAGEELVVMAGGMAGFNGGGAGGSSAGGVSVRVGGAGGGASDVRQGGAGVESRVLVAGGGGGGGGGASGSCLSSGGAGGGGGGGGHEAGAAGGTGTGCNTVISTGGAGGDQEHGGGGGVPGFNCGQSAVAGVAGVVALGGGGGGGVPCVTNTGQTGGGGGGGGGGLFGGGGGAGGPGGNGGAWAGGGGGGGSSWLGGVDNGSHEDGVHAGDGEVIVRW